MIRLSGTAADAAGAGQLQGSSGFGRRSLFRARRDGPDVPEKPVRRCFGQKVPGNGWAFANFFYLWRSKQYAMMDLKTIRAELRKLTAIVDGWEPSGEIPALERDLALEKLRTLYDAVRFTEVESLPESPVAETEPAAAPVPIDLGAVLSLDPTDEAAFEPGPDAVSGLAFDAEAESAEPFSEPDTTVAADSAGVFAGGKPDTETPGMAEPAASDSPVSACAPNHRIPSRNLRGNPDLSLIPKRRPKPHSSPENPNRPPNPGRSQHPNPRPCPNRLRSRSLRLNPRLCPNRLRSRSLRPDLPLRLNRSSFRNPLLRQLRNPLLRRNPNTSRPRCSGWRRRPSATVTNSASSCRSTIRPRPPKSPQGPKRRKDRRSVPNPLPVPNLL